MQGSFAHHRWGQTEMDASRCLKTLGTDRDSDGPYSVFLDPFTGDYVTWDDSADHPGALCPCSFNGHWHYPEAN